MNVSDIARGLALGDDGIWRSPETASVSYPSDGNEACFALEDASFWFQHRNQCIVSAIRAFPPAERGAIFDIGGGNGFVAKGIEAAGFPVALVEPGPSGARNARTRGLQTVICSTLESARFTRASLPAIGLFDVLEHVENDERFLRELKPLLVDGGAVYLTVPAYPFLWSDADSTAGHYRRYRLGALKALFDQSGFEIQFATYFFRPLVAPVFLGRTLPSLLRISRSAASDRKAAREHGTGQSPVTRFFLKSLSAEPGNIAQAKSMSFGASCLVVATRRPR